MVKALAVISGSLDSILAAKIVRDQGIDVTGVCFKSVFFSYERAVKEAEKLNIELKIIDVTDEHFNLVRNYAFNHKGIENICNDCNQMKLSYAFRTLQDIGANFLILAEDFNVNKMDISKESIYKSFDFDVTTLNEIVLRPLHLKYEWPTILEQRGFIDRKKLLKFNENLEKTRVEFAKEIGLKEIIKYEGQCKLTNPLFSSRLNKLFNYNKDCTVNDVEKLM